MKTNPSHPGRSADFLSRLYDGELTAAERAHFESHRAHCVECRKAAADFDAALSLYRSAKPSPAAPDLAARVLRKLQATSPPRRDPFGILFGINLKWAGAFAAALIAMIIGSSVVIRQQEKSAATVREAHETPISAALESSERGESPRKNVERPMPARPAAGGEKRKEESRIAVSGAPRASEPAAPRSEAEFAPAPPVEAPRKEDDKLREQKASAQPKAVPSREDLRADVRDELRARRAPVTSEPPSGGEAALPVASAMVLEERAPSLRLTILPWDGYGSAPRRLEPHPALSTEYRGREFILMVDALGRVRDIKPYARSAKPRADESAADTAAIEPTVPEALKGLRFAPGDRPRRLLLRIE